MSRLISLTRMSSWARSHALPAVFSRDVLLSLCSCAVDIAIFVIGVAVGLGIVPATFLARGCSAALNFLGCRYLVFRTSSRRRVLREAFAYLLLALMLAVASAYLVRSLYAHIGMSAAACKLFADGFLFGIAFVVKRFSVFRASPVSDNEVSVDDAVRSAASSGP